MENQPPSGQAPLDPREAFSSPLPPPPGQSPPPLGGPMPSFYPPYPPPPPQRPRRLWRKIVVVLLILVLGCSLLLNFGLLLFAGMTMGGTSSRAQVILEGDATQKIAVIPLKGIIADEEYQRVDRFFTQAEKDDQVKAVVLEIDSPGGTVSASDMIYHRIRKFKADHSGVPVVVSMGSMATSGGYYAACASDYIVAQRSTLTGNIGVLLPRYNMSQLVKTLGITETTITSEGSRFKNAGSMFKQDDPVETQYFQDLINQAFTQFKSVVNDGRKGKLARDKTLEEIANGKVYTAQDAKNLGLVDQVGYLEDAIAYAAKTAGLSNPTAVRYQLVPSLREMLLGAESRTQMSREGITLHLGAEMLDEMSRPRLMYLWRGQ